jgi:hypothetical protein
MKVSGPEVNVTEFGYWHLADNRGVATFRSLLDVQRTLRALFAIPLSPIQTGIAKCCG